VVALLATRCDAPARHGSCAEQATSEDLPVVATVEVGLAGADPTGIAVRHPATNGNISHVVGRPINESPPLRASESSMTPVHTGSAVAAHS
jgi:hypothetical protein